MVEKKFGSCLIFICTLLYLLLINLLLLLLLFTAIEFLFGGSSPYTSTEQKKRIYINETIQTHKIQVHILPRHTHITKPTNTHTHTLQNPHIHTSIH